MSQSIQGACRLDQVGRHVQHVFSLDAHPEEDGKKFRVAEAVPALADEFFTGQGL